jgi:ribosomal protein S18 acetylase RimI-like enzyme
MTHTSLRTMEVRDARPGEGTSLAAAVIAQPLLGRYRVSAEALARDLDAAIGRGEVLVAEEAGRPVGFAWFLPSGTLGLGGYLKLIALAPGGEGKGAGSLLLAEVELRVARSSRALFLLVSHWNERAQRFYAARGYAEVGRLTALILADTDELVFWKRLR